MINLESIEKEDVQALAPFVKKNSLFIAVHTGWQMFYEPIHGHSHMRKQLEQGKSVVEAYIDASIDHLITGMEVKLMGSNTQPFLRSMSYVLNMYELLRETAFLEYLREKQVLTLLVLPEDGPKSARRSKQYQQYLDETVGDAPHVITVETESYNNGYVFGRPKTQDSPTSYEGMVLANFFVLCNELGIENLHLFGGETNCCVSAAEDSFNLQKEIFETGQEITVLYDVSVCKPIHRQKALLDSESPLNPQIQEVLDQNINFSSLVLAKDLPIAQKIEVFEKYSALIGLSRQVQIYLADQHNNLALSAYKL